MIRIVTATNCSLEYSGESSQNCYVNVIRILLVQRIADEEAVAMS